MVDPQPPKIPEWNTGGANRTEPLSAEKIAGWAINDQPPSAYFNWLQYYTGAGLSWLYDRLVDGANEEDVTLQALTPDASGRGGDLTLEAGAPNTSGRGGKVDINARDALGSGAGGPINITCGDGVGSEGGDLTLKAGGGDTDGGDTLIEGGSPSGTDLSGGTTVLRTGKGTGTGAGLMRLQVSETGPAGSGVNAVTDYINLDGNAGAQLATHWRYSDFRDTDATRGSIRLRTKGIPSSASQQGDIYFDNAGFQVRVSDGTGHRGMNPLFLTPFTGSTTVTDATVTEKSFPSRLYSIPAGYLTVGSVIRLRVDFERLGSYADEPGFNIRMGPSGSHAAGPPPTGTIVSSVVPNSIVTGVLGYFSVDFEAHLVGPAGPAAQLDTSARWVAHTFPVSTVTNWQASPQVILVNSLASTATAGPWAPFTIDTTVVNEIFPTVVWFATGGGSQNMKILNMSMDII